MNFALNDINNINNLENIAPVILIILKWIIVIVMAGYAVFSALVLRQVKLMLDTVKIGFEAPIRFVAVGQLLLGIAILLFALFL